MLIDKPEAKNIYIKLLESNTNLGFWEFDVTTKRFFFSKNLSEKLNFPNQDSYLTEDLKVFFKDNDLEDFLTIIDAHIQRGFSLNFETNIKVNSLLSLLFKFHGQIFTENGQTPRIYGIAYDITEKGIIIDQLYSSNKSLTEFAQICSHDLQEPVRIIKNFVELISKKYLMHLNQEAREYFGFIHNSATQAHNIIKNILHYSTIQHSPLQLEFIDLNSLNCP